MTSVAAGNAFFREAIERQESRTVTFGGYAASLRAVLEMKTDGEFPSDTKLRSSKHLNNLVEQDDRGTKP
jgi:transposase-like protein